MKKVTSIGAVLMDMLLQPLDRLPRPGNPVVLDTVDMMLGGLSLIHISLEGVLKRGRT